MAVTTGDANRDVIKKAETIQKYFNKISITRASDLVGGESPDNEVFTAFGGYKTSLEGFTSIDQSRIQRYREYEQMTYVPEMNAGLELYADDASLYNEDDRVVDVQADNQDVAETLNNLWFRSLDMNSNLWHIVFNTCKYGDAFYEIIPDNYKNPKKIKYMKFIPPEYVARQEQDGNLLGFLVRIPNEDNANVTYSTTGEGEEVFLKPWQVVHFKLDDKEFDPYGKSVLESGRLAFKQMKLIEDAMLIYRISRAPERRIFNIPVGQLPYREAMSRVEDFKQKYRKTPWIDPTSGEINYKANPLSINDDFFLPKRPDGTGVTIETLQGGQQLGEIDDVRYFKEKILRTMRIPMSYLTGEMTGDVAKTSLAAMDVRFAKTIERIQKMIIKGLEKLSIIELAFKRFRIDDMYNFQLTLTTPSKIYEMQELETLTQKLNVIQTATSLVDENGKPYLPREWLYRNINKFNEEEIATIKLMQQAEMAQKQEDARRAEMAQQATEAGTEAGVAGGGEFPGGAEGGEEATAAGGTEGGGGAGAEADVGAPEGGGEEATAGGEEGPAPADSGGGAEMEVASKILNIASEKFLLENEGDLREVINFVKAQGENAQITKDKPKDKKRKYKMYENSFDTLFLKGEFKGLIRRKKPTVLKD